MKPDEQIDRCDADRREFTIRMWQIYRDYVIREDTLLAQRLGNFLLHQAFLFAAVAALMNRVIEDAQKANDARLSFFGLGNLAPDTLGILVMILIGIAGLAASIASARSTRAAHQALETLRRSWIEWKAAKEPKVSRLWADFTPREITLPEYQAQFEPYGLPGIDSAGSEEVRKIATFPSDAKDIPAVFAGVWIVFIFLMAGLFVGTQSQVHQSQEALPQSHPAPLRLPATPPTAQRRSSPRLPAQILNN